MKTRCRFALIFIGALVLSACSQTTNQRQGLNTQNEAGSPAFSQNTTKATIREGLRNITKRYIDPIKMDVLALGGMRGLATIDPSLAIVDTTDSIQILMNGAILKSFAKPANPNATRWATLTTQVIQTARTHSPDMKNADNERILEAVFDGILSNLDIFSRYAGNEEARTNRAKRDGFGGIGIQFSKVKDGILITHVAKKSPANRAGLKPGDVIVKVDTQTVRKRSLRHVAKWLRGPVGSTIFIAVERVSNQPSSTGVRRIDFNLKRAYIIPETVRTQRIDDILTLSISSFNKNTAPSVHEALDKYKNEIKNRTLHGVVMDLRGNPGGLLSQSVDVADLFLDKGLIITTQGRHPDSYHEYQAGGRDLSRGLPLVLLIDGNSASAAEIVASALQDLGRAVVVGSTSYGKGTVQTVIRLPNDGEMTLTWSRLISPSGYALHGLGVMPTVCATNTTVPGSRRRDTATTNATTKATSRANQDKLERMILAPKHINDQRAAMVAWRAAKMIFDDRRGKLRQTCPAQIFKPKSSGDLLALLAKRIIAEPDIYQRAVLLSDPVNTASR